MAIKILMCVSIILQIMVGLWCSIKKEYDQATYHFAFALILWRLLEEIEK